MVDGGMTCLEKGADIKQIEKANLDLGFPIGSMGLLQLLGASTILKIQKNLNKIWPDRFKNYKGLQRMVAEKKNKVFIQSEKQLKADPEVSNIWQRKNHTLASNEINEIVMTRLTTEIYHLLNEGIVESYKDVDTGMILGVDWPFFNGGITALLDDNGYSEKALGRKIRKIFKSG